MKYKVLMETVTWIVSIILNFLFVTMCSKSFIFHSLIPLAVAMTLASLVGLSGITLTRLAHYTLLAVKMRHSHAHWYYTSPYSSLASIIGLYVMCLPSGVSFINSTPPGWNGRHFADDIFRCIFINEVFGILIEISLKFVPKGPIDNNPALV